MTDTPEGLKEAGQALWEDTVRGRALTKAHEALLVNICRIADRLDDISEELIDAPLTVTLYDKRGEPINEVAQPLLGEHRQQLATMSQLMTRLGIKELPAASAGGKSWEQVVEDEVAKKRAEKTG